MINMDTIWAALIAGAFSFLGIIVTSISNNKKITAELKAELSKNQAVTDYKIDELTREVREHNNFAKRMPALEERVEGISEKINILHKQ